MFANPEVSAFIDKLIGGQTPHGGTPPPTPSYRGSLARGLFGDITQPEILGGFQAPTIAEYRHPLTQPLQTEGVGRSGGSQQVPESEVRGGKGDTGASALTAGLGKLGQGIESGLKTIAQKNQEAGKTAALSQGGAWAPYPSGALGASPGGASGIAGTANTTVGASGAADSTGARLPSFARQPGVSAETPTTAPGDYLSKVQAIENPSGNPYARSSTGATGKWQFIRPTWNQFGGGGDIHDPAAQDAAMQRFTQSNFNALQDGLGRPPTDGELYLAHQQGAAGALKLLQNPNMPPSQLGLGRAVSVNNGNPNAPASAFIDKWGSRFGGAQSYADQNQDRQQDANDPISRNVHSEQTQQPVISGQTDPHKPGFDPSSVSFTNTPIGGQQQSTSGASTTPPVSPGGGQVQSGVYQGQPYTFQTQPVIGPQSMLYPSQDSSITDATTQEQNYFSGPLHMIPPGSTDMPKSLAPLPERQFPTGPGNLGVADASQIQMSPLALALAGGQMPSIDPSFGGGFGGGFGGLFG